MPSIVKMNRTAIRIMDFGRPPTSDLGSPISVPSVFRLPTQAPLSHPARRLALALLSARDGAPPPVSFFCFAPTTSLVLVPVGSVDVPFIFEEVTSDFQQVTVQGQVTYRVADPKKLSQLMNFTLAPGGKGYASDDPKKLPQRLINHAQVLTRASLKSLPLRQALGQSENLVSTLRQGLQTAEVITSLGVEVLGLQPSAGGGRCGEWPRAGRVQQLATRMGRPARLERAHRGLHQGRQGGEDPRTQDA